MARKKLTEKERKANKAAAQKRWKEAQKALRAAGGAKVKAPKAKKSKSSRGEKIKAAWAAKRALAAGAAELGGNGKSITGTVSVKIGRVTVERAVTQAEAAKVIEGLV